MTIFGACNHGRFAGWAILAALVAACTGERAARSAAGGGGSDTGLVTAILPDTVRMQPARDTATPPPPPRHHPVDTQQPQERPMARLVRGRVEIRAGGERHLPAEYFTVVLEGAGRRFEAVTNRSGEFFLDSVPSGPYLLVLLAGKGMPIHKNSVEIAATDSVFPLPHVHIAAEQLPRK